MKRLFPQTRHSHRRVRVAALGLYVVLALSSTWPLARHALTALPVGGDRISTVPLFNLWTVWWNADRLRHGFRGYWDAPIFHPADDTFAFSEPQPFTVIVSPIIWLTGSRALAYNIYLGLSLVLNAIFAERLLRCLGARRSVAIGGGAATLLLPIVHWQREVLQLVPLWGILWAWTALWRTSRQPSLRHGLELGAAFGVTMLMCVHHGLFLAVLLAGGIWSYWTSLRRLPMWLALLMAIVAAGVIAGPIIVKLHQVARRYDFMRTTDLVAQLSAQPVDYTAAPGWRLISWNAPAARPFWRLSPGWLKVGLAVVGVAFGLTRRRWRHWSVFLLVTTILAFLLSLGTNLQIGEWQPWSSLTKFVPGLAQVRNVFRFAFFVQVAVVLLAAQGIHGLWLLSHGWFTKKRGRAICRWVIASVGLAAMIEVLPASTKLRDVPDAAAHAGWIEFVREQTPRGAAIACFPFAQGEHVADFAGTARWMYFGTFHRVPLVNGYSGFFPPEDFELRDALLVEFPSEATLQRLAATGVAFLVIDASTGLAETLRKTTFENFTLERAYHDDIGIDVFRLRATPADHRVQPGGSTA